MKQLLFFFLFIVSSSSQIPTKDEIDEKISNLFDGIIYNELRLAKVYRDFYTQIQNCVKDLKTSNALTTALNNMANIILQQSTIKNFKAYENISTCGDINYKIMLIELDQKKLNCLIAKVSSNISAINTQYTSVVVAASQSPPIAECVISIFQQTLSTFSEFAIYRNLLITSSVNLGFYGTILNTFKKLYCQCLASVALTGFNSTLENLFQTVDNLLIKDQSTLLNLTSTALSKVKSAQSSIPSSASRSYQSLQTTLSNILTTSDHTSNNWSNVKNCNDMLTRRRFIQWKQNSYFNILPSINQNRSLCSMYRSGIAAAVPKASQSQSLQDALNATLKVEGLFQKYLIDINFAIGRMTKVIADFGVYGDTYCTCEIQGATTSSEGTTKGSELTTSSVISSTNSQVPLTTTVMPTTSTSTTEKLTTTTSTTEKPTTTTSTTEEPTTTTSTTTTSTTTSTTTTTTTQAPTVLPCGTFLKYDIYNNPSAIVQNGFYVGTFYDGSDVYAGVGNNGGCGPGPQNPCPCRLTTKPSKPGAYCSCGGGEPYDAQNPMYVMNNPALYWIPTNKTEMANLTEAIVVQALGGIKLMIGRAKVGNYTTICKGHCNQGLFGCWYQKAGGGEVFMETGYDVLACKS